MRHYELMVIYASRLDEEGLQAQIERTKELIASVGGEVDKVDVWGKRRFAYEINDNTDGFYVVIGFPGGKRSDFRGRTYSKDHR